LTAEWMLMLPNTMSLRLRPAAGPGFDSTPVMISNNNLKSSAVLFGPLKLAVPSGPLQSFVVVFCGPLWPVHGLNFKHGCKKCTTESGRECNVFGGFLMTDNRVWSLLCSLAVLQDRLQWFWLVLGEVAVTYLRSSSKRSN